MKLHLGCGTVVPEDWINVDYALGARVRQVPVLGAMVGRLGIFDTAWNPEIVLHDLRKALPWPDGSTEAVYTSHTLEHLDKDQGERFIRECQRVLRPGGILRVVVPNLRWYAKEYLDGRLPARDLLSELYVLGARDVGAAKAAFSLFTGSNHRCMYDDTALTELMQAHGLSARVRQPRDSEIADIERFEPPLDAWTDDMLGKNLFVEGRKDSAAG